VPYSPPDVGVRIDRKRKAEAGGEQPNKKIMKLKYLDALMR
jgi:hypothetical protein